jgi:nucleoside-diphosphate-sugar epimerase
MRVENPEYSVYNIGKENERTIKDLAREILGLTGTESNITYRPLPEDDPSQRQPDITRAKTDLGWQPSISLRDVLERTIEYFESLSND